MKVQKMMKKLSVCIILFYVVSHFCLGRQNNGPVDKGIWKAAYDLYKEQSITHRRFKHKDILPLIEKRQFGDVYRVTKLGSSIEARDIYQLGYGQGDIKVLLWSQMHGNESTATMALFDLFNFLEAGDDEFESIRQTIREKLDLRFIPMVNPDGAEAFIRRNALDIDLNRDAIQLTSPESVILRKAREDFGPDFGFNLHDQQIYYNVERTPKPATISVLAPAFNYETEINDVRRRALQVIVGMNGLLQEIIPGHVGKYDDGFEPRAFGDNFQRWGTSAILIESGGYPGDPEKQYIRELNFIIILNALYEIAQASYTQYEVADYFAIPDNDSKLMDVMLRNVTIKRDDLEYMVDLGIRRREIEGEEGYYTESSIIDIGDLSVYYGYDEIDAEGYVMKEGKVYEKELNALPSYEETMDMLKKGYLWLRVKTVNNSIHQLPINIFQSTGDLKAGAKLGSKANFLLEKEGMVHYAIINGYLIDLRSPKDQNIQLKIQ
ncbi:M14 family metallopeptidase [Anditalea andensis]|uniref:Peptidase M14 n=1 Tax=Anditalea andensis TaxID=1048983 RepID=A0A074KTG1_9BACT|nr:M14 metallopeptidase family protein [Anditalea andensis]KEO72174.1 peptidase M14 [Anditalea andensis]